MRDGLVMVITMICCVAGLRRPAYGMLAFVAFGILAPHGFTWSFARTFPHSLAISASTLVGFVLHGGARRIPMQRETVLLGIVWLWFCLSTIFAVEQDLAQDKLLLISKIFFMVFLSMAILNSREQLQNLARAIALPIGLLALRGVIFFVRMGGSEMVEGPAEGILLANNSIGLAMAMNVPLLVYLLRTETNVWLIRAARIMLFASYPAVIGTFSRGAWLALAAVTLLLVLRSKHRFLIVVVGAVGLMMGSALFPLLVSERVAERAGTFQEIEKDNSAQQRFGSWEFCAKVGLYNPIFGAGIDYYSLKMYEAYSPEYAERWNLKRWGGRAWSCHSMWFTILGEHGVFAFLIWVGLLVSCFFSLGKLKKYGILNQELAWLVPWADVLRISFVGYAVAGTFLDFAYFDVYYQLIAAVIILKDQMQRQLSEKIVIADMPASLSYPESREAAPA
jgi:probable O-glycosylation ligase (exosortase A-associated)